MSAFFREKTHQYGAEINQYNYPVINDMYFPQEMKGFFGFPGQYHLSANDRERATVHNKLYGH